MITLGNDIVDLADAPKKYLDRRFLARVFTQAEQGAIHDSTSPHQLLWALWAAKEAAFKAYQKQQLHYRFSPIKCEVELPHTMLAKKTGERISTGVTIQQQKIHCQWQFNNGYVHCIALFGGNDFALVRIAIEKNDLAVSSQSVAVRALALRLCEAQGLKRLNITRAQLTLDGYQKLGPPVLTERGVTLVHELSLSHDGDYLAATLLKK